MNERIQKPYVIFEYWQAQDMRFYARLRIAQTMIDIGHGYRLRADCAGAIGRMAATTVDTPIKFLTVLKGE